MEDWKQAIGRLRAWRPHWRVSFIAIGLMMATIAAFGIGLNPIGILFIIAGFIIGCCGIPALGRFVGESEMRKGNDNVGMLIVLLCSAALTPTLLAVDILLGRRVDNYGLTLAAFYLGSVYFALPKAMLWVEPKDFHLQRLSSRIRRAAIFRTIANGAGIGAVAALLSLRFLATYPAPLISITLTLMVAMAVVTHKTFARVRKLCTQIYIDVQELLRNLDDLADTQSVGRTLGRWQLKSHTNNNRPEREKAVHRSWDSLQLDLRTTMDSGYRLFAMPFLPDNVITDLEKTVSAAVADPEAVSRAQRELRMILNACAARIDVLA
ncbi:hypothetical protein [Streptomyces sp. CB00316]|uniref:hypothetical protein n=1 Tax=Streptomyces sp. CB00316 TaxID=1703932 RepID=UPI001160F494|nr:hypothetical protein [Streptomyces sp. CB00316]